MNKNGKTLIILIAALAVLLGGGYAVYHGLSEKTETPTSPAQTENGREDLRSFTVYDADGNEVSSLSFTGKPAVINFWATWCPPCCAELPYFNDAFAKYGDDVNFVMVNLTDGERETQTGVQAFLEENGYSFPVYYDLRYDAASAYSITSIPLSVFVDKNGKVYTTHLGMLSESVLNTTINALLSE